MALVTPDDPPMFLYHGTFDFTVGAENARVMYDALKGANVPAEFHLYRGLEHLFAGSARRRVSRSVSSLTGCRARRARPAAATSYTAIA